MVSAYIMWATGGVLLILSLIFHREERTENIIAALAALGFGVFF